jgi:hypothetical protein
MIKKEYILTLSLIVLLSSIILVRFGTVNVKASSALDPDKIYGVKMLWNNSMTVYDIAISKDGSYIAVVNNTGLYYFAYNESTPKWWYQPQTTMLSVVISANGTCVATGSNSGNIYYFNNATLRVGDQSDPTWVSGYLYGAVERGTIDISDDGVYVAAGGTGWNVYYYANCTQREGPDQPVTWGDWLSVVDILAVDLSPDGTYLAVGGANTSQAFVAYYRDANMEPYPNEPNWSSWSWIQGSSVRDLAVSDDGYGVAAITVDFLSLHYWANATMLSGNPNATWVNGGGFLTLEMSADGNEIVTGSAGLESLHFWSNATKRQGLQAEDWIKLESELVEGVAINDGGNVIAASSQTAQTNYTAYFFKTDGTMIANFTLLQHSPIVSMSGNGRITAMGGPPDSLYVFELLVDSTPPLIDDVYQEPASDNVLPDDTVMVYANVTDDLSGVKQVILAYTTDNETWVTVNMTNLEGDQYNGTIEGYPYCTTVRYVITAVDNYNNTITTVEKGYEYTYHVIPEFALQLFIPLFLVATVLALMLRRRKLYAAKT